MAVISMGLRSEEFLDLTLRQFYVLHDRHSAAMEHQKLLFGVVAASVANFSYHVPDRPFSPADFFRRRRSRRTRAERETDIASTRAVLMSMTVNKNA